MISIFRQYILFIILTKQNTSKEGYRNHVCDRSNVLIYYTVRNMEAQIIFGAVLGRLI